jgi:chromosome segregation ATPase
MTDKPGFSRVGSASVDEQQMAQIREILFGEQSRQTAQQIGRLEARLGEQDQALHRVIEERVAALSGALDALRADLGSQGERQQAALDGLERTLRSLLDGFDKRLAMLDSDLQDSRRHLEQSVAQQAEALDRLQQTGIGRAQLADMLETLARQLRSPTVT